MLRARVVVVVLSTLIAAAWSALALAQASPNAPAPPVTAAPTPTSSVGTPSEAAPLAPTQAPADAHVKGAGDAVALAKATQNPVADLVSLPFQFNFNNGGGLGDETMFNLNFQPVIPIHLGSRVNLIARSIVPILSVPNPNGGRDRGMGDIQEQLFLAPSAAGKVVWGLGPMLSFPTATVPSATTGSWGLGPSGVFVINAGPFVLGGLVSQVWNIKDNAGPPRTNIFSAQPFVNYNFGAGWALGLAPIITASWDADRSNTWTLPLGGSVSKTLVFDKQPMTLSFQYYRNVIRPDGAPANQIRVVLNFLFPGKA
jgi:hypothetical protein